MYPGEEGNPTIAQIPPKTNGQQSGNQNVQNNGVYPSYNNNQSMNNPYNQNRAINMNYQQQPMHQGQYMPSNYAPVSNIMYQQPPQPSNNQQYYQQYQQQMQGNGMYGQQTPQQQPQYHHRTHHYGNPQPQMQQQQQQQQPYMNMQQPQSQFSQQPMNMNYGQNMTPSNIPSRKKVTLKMLILGNSGVGKTSLMNRYQSNKFTGQYKATIGADFTSKQITLGGTKVTLTMWDTAGQERFQSLGTSFYRGSDVAMLVYDVTDRSSFDGLSKWKEEYDKVNGDGEKGAQNSSRFNNGMNASSANNGLKYVVVANKADKDDGSKVVSNEEGMAYAKSIGCMFFECSAKSALNVEESFMAAAKAGLEYSNQKQMTMSSSMMGPGGYSPYSNSMPSYVPPQRTVDLNRGQSSMSDGGDCC